MATSLLHLHSKNLSVVFKLGRIPEIIHWGNKITHIDEDLLLATERPISQARLDVDVPLSICPELGAGHFNAPGLEGHRNGKDFAPVFQLENHTVTDNSVTFALADRIAQLALTVTFTLDHDSDVLQQQLHIENIGDTPYQLDKLACTIPLPYHAKELMTFHGAGVRSFKPSVWALNTVASCRKTVVAAPLTKTSRACLPARKALANKVVRYGVSI